MVKVLEQKSRFLLTVEGLISLSAVLICMSLRLYTPDADAPPFGLEHVLKGLLYTGILHLSLFLNDAHHVQILANRRQLLPRLARSALVSIMLYAVVNAVIPEQTQGRLVFMGSVIITFLFMLGLHAALRGVLHGRMFLEKVLVVGEGSLADTLRQELTSADYHQRLCQDPALEGALINAILRLGRGETSAHEALTLLDGELDLVVMAMGDAEWLHQRLNPEASLPKRAVSNGLSRGSSGGARSATLKQALLQSQGALARAGSDATGLVTASGAATGSVPADGSAHAGVREAFEASHAPVKRRTSHGSGGRSEDGARVNSPAGADPTGSQVVRLDAHRRRPRYARLSSRTTVSGFASQGEQTGINDRDALVRGLVALKLSGIPVVRGLDYYEELTGRVYIGHPVDSMFYFRSPYRLDKLSHMIKAMWEWCIALTMFVAVIPFLILVPIAIWLDDGKNPLFIQKRVGRFGEVYNLYKWRSMDDKGNVTRVGRFIRKTKLDELPQLINVLRGEMALVGPRPEMPRFVQQFEEHTPYYSLRHMVRPGLTGWAQIMFPDAKAEDAMVKLSLDLYYVKNFSLVSDIVIMVETLKMILFGGMARAMRVTPPVQLPQLSLVKSDGTATASGFPNRDRGDRTPVELGAEMPTVLRPRSSRAE